MTYTADRSMSNSLLQRKWKHHTHQNENRNGNGITPVVSEGLIWFQRHQREMAQGSRGIGVGKGDGRRRGIFEVGKHAVNIRDKQIVHNIVIWRDINCAIEADQVLKQRTCGWSWRWLERRRQLATSNPTTTPNIHLISSSEFLPWRPTTEKMNPRLRTRTTTGSTRRPGLSSV